MREIDTGTMDPDAVLDWTWDWTAWLTDGDTITTVELLPEGVTIDRHSHTDTTVTAWLSGPTGHTARVTCRITTTQGRRDDRTLRLHITDR